MTSTALLSDFSTVLTDAVDKHLLTQLNSLRTEIQPKLEAIYSLAHFKIINFDSLLSMTTEQEATDAFIKLFDALFADQEVQLVRGQHEPEYFPATKEHFARIEFAHGFFASALHEIHTPLYRLTC